MNKYRYMNVKQCNNHANSKRIIVILVVLMTKITVKVLNSSKSTLLIRTLIKIELNKVKLSGRCC